jgi:hypothetical protein
MMKTAIGYPHYYTLICKRAYALPGCFRPLHLHRGNYNDIRDVMHQIINYRTRYVDTDLIFMIEAADRKPIGWVHRSRYICE